MPCGFSSLHVSGIESPLTIVQDLQYNSLILPKEYSITDPNIHCHLRITCCGGQAWEYLSTVGRSLAGTGRWAQSSGGSLCGRWTGVSSSWRFHPLDHNACPGGSASRSTYITWYFINTPKERKKSALNLKLKG